MRYYLPSIRLIKISSVTSFSVEKLVGRQNNRTSVMKNLTISSKISRNQGSCQRLLESCQVDAEANLKRLLLAKGGIIQLPIRTITVNWNTLSLHLQFHYNMFKNIFIAFFSCRGWWGVDSWVFESRKLRPSRRGDCTRRLGSRHQATKWIYRVTP